MQLKWCRGGRNLNCSLICTLALLPPLLHLQLCFHGKLLYLLSYLSGEHAKFNSQMILPRGPRFFFY
uniref:Putative secreted protein n=1 Tax=Ixodes ricinus TaxID=34613 RepID=A0A6B0TQJ0_IXORI